LYIIEIWNKHAAGVGDIKRKTNAVEGSSESFFGFVEGHTSLMMNSKALAIESWHSLCLLLFGLEYASANFWKISWFSAKDKGYNNSLILIRFSLNSFPIIWLPRNWYVMNCRAMNKRAMNWRCDESTLQWIDADELTCDELTWIPFSYSITHSYKLLQTNKVLSPTSHCQSLSPKLCLNHILFLKIFFLWYNI